MQNPLKSFGLVAMLFALIAGLMSLSGCAGGGAPAAVDPSTVSLKLNVARVEQYRTLDRKNADGQYLVTTLTLENTGNQAETVQPNQLLLTNRTDKEDEKYTQEVEKGMMVPFMRVYGQENMDRLLETQPVVVNPRVKAERYLIFMVPDGAVLESYNLLYKPYNLEIPLVSETTAIDDRRER